MTDEANRTTDQMLGVLSELAQLQMNMADESCRALSPFEAARWVRRYTTTMAEIRALRQR